jgi:hypothetical protein
MVWLFARSKGGSNSSVAALIAVEMNALISAAWAAPVAANSAMTIASARMTIAPLMPDRVPWIMPESHIPQERICGLVTRISRQNNSTSLSG